MSSITDIIVITLYEEIIPINKYLKETCNGAELIEVSKHAEKIKSTGTSPPSPRPMQCSVYVGAVNYLHEETFVDFIETNLSLEFPHCFQLLLKREWDDTFTYVNLKFRESAITAKEEKSDGGYYVGATNNCHYCKAPIKLIDRPDNFGKKLRWDNSKDAFCTKCCKHRHGRSNEICGGCKREKECDLLYGVFEEFQKNPQYYPGAAQTAKEKK